MKNSALVVVDMLNDFITGSLACHNAENAVKYQKLCISEFGEAAFEGLQEFAMLAKKYVPEVTFSVVDIMPENEIEACRKIAENCGVNFRVREFIK